MRRGAQAALAVHTTELQMSAHLPADQSKEKEPRAGEMTANVLMSHCHPLHKGLFLLQAFPPHLLI